jgi:FkbM family methyltransferase
MEDVGKFSERNSDFHTRWSLDQILKSKVTNQEPVIADIGAHRGESITRFLRLWPKATVFSFEPDPVSFRHLSKEWGAHAQVEIFEIALSSTSGSARFFRNKLSHTNSLSPLNMKSRDSIALNSASVDSETMNSVVEEFQVTICSLDDWCLKRGKPKFDLVKIDVQGREADVLNGAPLALATAKCVQVEVSLFDYYAERSEFWEVDRTLRAAGLALWSVLQVSNNPMNGRTDWVELLYSREDGHSR